MVVVFFVCLFVVVLLLLAFAFVCVCVVVVWFFCLFCVCVCVCVWVFWGWGPFLCQMQVLKICMLAVAPHQLVKLCLLKRVHPY